VILELAPGIRAIEITPPFDLGTCIVHANVLITEDEPLSFKSKGPPSSPIVSFAANPTRFVVPPGCTSFGWLVRVHVDVMSGRAVLAAQVDDRSELSELDEGDTWGTMLVPGPPARAEIVLQRATFARRTDLRVLGFQCFCLLEDESQQLEAPPWPAFELTARWSHYYGQAPTELASQTRELRFRRLPSPRSMPWVEGLELLIAPHEQISRAVYLSGKYEPCTTAVLRRLLKPGQTFIDVGANIGLFTTLASRWVGPRGQVIAFEPSQRELARLRGHVDHNACENVRVVASALGAHEGTAVLHVADVSCGGLNTLQSRFMYDTVEEAYTETVSVERLDDDIQRHNVSAVDVIKIDVEGAEHDVIDGARDTIGRYRPALLIETVTTASAGPSPGQRRTEAFLRDLGYALVAIDAESGKLTRVAHLEGWAENLLAAPPEVIAALHREIPIDDSRPNGATFITSKDEIGAEQPYVSIIITGRNDDFGGNFNDRLFRALEFNHHHLTERGISHEFVFVEWRPITGKPWLADVLADRYPALVPHALTTYVVDLAYHDAYSLNPKLQFQEFIAKNIGIRRCRGRFILTTNTDIYFGRGVLEFLQEQSLQPRVLYRVPRIDLKDHIDCDGLDWAVLEDERNYDRINHIVPPCYTNASGDFLLLDRESYFALHGFNEVYRVAKIHMDGNFCIKAHSAGMTLTAMPTPVYHVGLGTLNSQKKIYADRPEEAPWGDQRWNGEVVYENDPDWGLWRAPSRTLRPGLEYLDFSWNAVPPVVALRRVVLRSTS
jgi:FkbM family methyltransferase